MAKFGKKRFPENYQHGVGMKAKPRLHDNSKELASVLKDHTDLIKPKIFELGSGPARNLHYILKEHPLAKLYCSDLYKEASLKHMSKEVVDVITFFEGDSEKVINDHVIKDLDLFLVSDHFMHLEYNKVDNIIKKVMSEWKPKYIMLREVKKEFETPDHPRLFHNYHYFLSDYDLIYEKTSEFAREYFIWILKRS